jgi:triacylglycerol lipase
MNIVLVHGVLGAHIFAGKPYFNGVADHLRKTFHAHVFEPELKPIGTVAVRAKELRRQILEEFGTAPPDKLIVIAHSMGGLDSRQMLTDDAELAKSVKSLCCVATPHLGSRVATLLDVANPLPLFGNFFANVDAVHDLSEEGAREINATCPDRDGIHYRQVAGIGREGEKPVASFFRPLRKIVGDDSDDVVTVESATAGRHLLEKVHADHADLVGHDVDDLPELRPRKFEHLAMYERIVRDAM